MNIRRFYLDRLDGMLAAGKVLALYGPRRAGKTTLLKEFLKSWRGGRCFFGTGEDRQLGEILGSGDVELIRGAFSGYELAVIDEAQALKNVGRGLKLLVDTLPEIKVIASGSSSFQLAGELGEPLTGRKRTATLYPVAALEYASEFGNMSLRQKLNEWMIFGGYPEVLTELCNSYLFKDILAFERVRNADKLHRLLSLLVFQVGKEVSLTELGTALGLNRATVERYLDLLEKTFVIFRVPGFSRNLRSEVIRTSRYYFYDNGVMNAITTNFNPLELRGDSGALWENLLVAERRKKQCYHKIFANNYFWRTYERQEVDWVEERDGNLFGYEFKWGDKPVKTPSLWRSAYPSAHFEVVDRKNFADFIM